MRTTLLALLIGLMGGCSMMGVSGLPDVAQPLHTGQSAMHDAAIIISIEAYHGSIGSNVPDAHRDGDAMANHLRVTRGVPEERVIRLRGASCDELKGWVRRAAALVHRSGTLWVYFAGHGSRSQAAPVLVCDDTRGDEFYFHKTVPVAELIAIAERSEAGRAILVIDAGFASGHEERPWRYCCRPRMLPHSSKVAVWLASSGRERAERFAEMGHGVFTWLALGALRGWADGETTGRRDGTVTLDEAQAFVRRALRALNRRQTPVLLAPHESEPFAVSRSVSEAAPSLEALSNLR